LVLKLSCSQLLVYSIETIVENNMFEVLRIIRSNDQNNCRVIILNKGNVEFVWPRFATLLYSCHDTYLFYLTTFNHNEDNVYKMKTMTYFVIYCALLCTINIVWIQFYWYGPNYPNALDSREFHLRFIICYMIVLNINKTLLKYFNRVTTALP